jgi:hypothetical protein
MPDSSNRPPKPDIGATFSNPSRGADTFAYSEPVPLIVYYRLLRERWRLIAVWVALVMVATFLVTELARTHYYRATAILRPVAEQDSLNRLQGVVSAIGGSALMGMLGGGSEANQAEEYVSILKSYEFTIQIVDQHHLAKVIYHPRWWTRWLNGNQPPSQYQLFKIMNSRFECEYDRLTGNITMHFLDPDRRRSEVILGYYVDALRNKLRQEELRSAGAAITSLEAQARATSDVLLQSRLYELLAHQVQRDKLAQVEADFAFKVIDPPISADKPYTPNALLDSVLLGILVLLAVSFWVIVTASEHAERVPETYPEPVVVEPRIEPRPEPRPEPAPAQARLRR